MNYNFYGVNPTRKPYLPNFMMQTFQVVGAMFFGFRE